MGLPNGRRWLAVGLTAGLASVSTLFASAFTVAPLRVNLSPQESSTLITISNPTDLPLNLQISGFQWSLDQSGEHLKSTEDILFFPHLIEVPPHGEGRVRIGSMVPFESVEKSYRLIIEELQRLEKFSGQRIQFLARFSIPVFLAPTKPVKDLRIVDASHAGGRFFFRTENHGNVHSPPHKLHLSGLDASGIEIFVRELDDWYLLPGSSRPFTIEIPAEICLRLKTIEIQGEADGTPFSQRVQVGADACAR